MKKLSPPVGRSGVSGGTAATPSVPQPAPRSNDPLHGITLERMVTELAAHYGWPELGRRIKIRCFNSDPSIKSSLQFLRRTPWARTKVEALYRHFLRQARRSPVPGAPPPAPAGQM